MTGPAPEGAERSPRTSRRLAAALLALGGGVALAGCGAPTARVLEAGEGPVRFEVPVEFTDLPAEAEGLDEAWGLPSSVATELNNDPVLYLHTSGGGESTSFRSLRSLVTGGQYDPIDPAMSEMAQLTGTQVIEYQEISQPDVWGIRMQVAMGRGARDFQVLVDRRSGEVVISELVCTQACFLEQFDLIDQIQGSWSLES